MKKSIIFKDLFDARKIMELKKDDARLYANLVKVKQILDLIETKGYKSFFKEDGGIKNHEILKS